MQKPLSERAALRCEQAILRAFPAWRQAEIRSNGSPDQQSDLQAFIDANKSVLRDKRAAIADGIETCIDTGWAEYGAAPVEQQAPAPEPVDIDATIARMEAAQAKLKGDTPAQEPPAEIADLFDAELTARQNQEKLVKLYATLMSERELKLSHDDKTGAQALLDRAERVQTGITWNRATFAEIVG